MEICMSMYEFLKFAHTVQDVCHSSQQTPQ